MSNVIQFPKIGEQVALYTNRYMYVGTAANSESIMGRTGIWLTDAAIMPIRGQVVLAEVLRLGSVLVMWDQVEAMSPAPEFGSSERPG
uniref:Putative KleE stable inheritance protein n=1 Tax=Siphoviridae sp. ctvok7 TaxID=2827596 RepID=A0A8S5LM15_9CAUD|nr:MAG TPA: putative KleE stable inheritance protein [Siphoviridae sp. ctvok7]